MPQPLDAGLACRGSSAFPMVGVREGGGGSGRRQAAMESARRAGGWDLHGSHIVGTYRMVSVLLVTACQGSFVTRFNLHLISPLFGNMYLHV